MMRWPSIPFVFVAAGRPPIAPGQTTRCVFPAYRNSVSSPAVAFTNYSTGLGDMHKVQALEAPGCPVLPPVRTGGPIPRPLTGGTYIDGRRPNRALDPRTYRYGRSFDCKQHLQTDDMVVAQ